MKEKNYLYKILVKIVTFMNPYDLNKNTSYLLTD